MLTYSRLSRKPVSFRSFTGMTVQEFDILFSRVEREYARTEQERLSARKRERRVGAGNQFKLTLKDRLLMHLVYYRLYVTYELTGFLFGLDQSNVSRDIRYLEPAIRGCIPIPQKICANAKKASTVEQLLQYFPDLMAFTDASEQPIPRPQYRTKRKTHYSGKKKYHTVKTQYTVNKDGKIMHKTRHSPGRRHDYSVYKIKHMTLPGSITSFLDLGYLGIQNDFPQEDTVLPYKKQRGAKLDAEQKRFNRCHSKMRVVVEHTISKIKKFRIMWDRFRNRLCRYDVINDIICGLVNLRIEQHNMIVVP